MLPRFPAHDLLPGSLSIRRMVHTLRFGQREVDLGTPVTGNESLSHGYWRELTSSDRGAIST